MRQLFYFAVAAISVGCSVMSYTELREAPGEPFVFIAEGSAQDVYKRIVTRARDCYPNLSQGDFFTDKNKGTISIGSGRADMLIDVENHQGKAQVTVFHNQYVLGNKSNAEGVEKWVRENSRTCHFWAK